MGLEREGKLFQTPELSRHPELNGEVNRYLTYLIIYRDRPENTIFAYRNDLSQLCKYLDLSNTPFDWNTVTGVRLDGFLCSLEEDNYAPATVARKIASVKSFFHWLKAVGRIEVDPTDVLEVPKVADSSSKLLKKDEIAVLLAAPEARGGSEAKRDSAMLQLLGATGMRVSEMLALTREDVNLTVNYVRCLTPRHEREIPFDLKTHDAIQKYLEGVHAETDTLFVNHRGERLTRGGFWLILKGYARSVGLSGVNNHTLRHSFAVHLFDDSAKVESVQYLLGHVSTITTKKHAPTQDRTLKAG